MDHIPELEFNKLKVEMKNLNNNNKFKIQRRIKRQTFTISFIIIALLISIACPFATCFQLPSIKSAQQDSIKSPTTGDSSLQRKLESVAKTGGDWLVREVAPAVIKSVIRNGRSDGIAEAAKTGVVDVVNSQAIANTIVDSVAKSVKARRVQRKLQNKQLKQISDDDDNPSAEDNQTKKSVGIEADKFSLGVSAVANQPSSRRGKSLVTDGLQAAHSLLSSSQDRPSIFGRAIEKRDKLLKTMTNSLHNSFQQHNQQQHNQQHSQQQQQQQTATSAHSAINSQNANSQQRSNGQYAASQQQQPQQVQNASNWFKDFVDPGSIFTSTSNIDTNSLLDDNPLVIRAEHSLNQTSTDQYDKSLSPIISNLMAPQAANTIQQSQTSNSDQTRTRLSQKQRHQQKIAASNRYQAQQQQQQPQPQQPQAQQQPQLQQQPQQQQLQRLWQQQQIKPVAASVITSQNQSSGSKRQSSPYSIQPTSDISIVRAPSSPSPLSTFGNLIPQATTVATPPTIITSTTMTNQSPYQQHNSFSIGTTNGNNNNINRHKLSNGRPIFPVSQSSTLWQPQNQQQRRFQSYQQQQPSTTSTTTTTTTTTPEPQTEPPIVDTMDSLSVELDQQTTPPASSLIASVVGSALESFSSSAADTEQPSENYQSSPIQTNTLTSNSTVGPKSLSQGTTARHSILSNDAIPTALSAPLYHLTRANYTVTSIMGPPPRRSSVLSPSAKAAVKYLQKSLNNLPANIFSRANKSWARRFGLGSVLLSGLIYSAAVLANPGAPLPTTGLEVLQALARNKRRRGIHDDKLSLIDNVAMVDKHLALPFDISRIGPANLLTEQQLLPILEEIIETERQKQLQSSPSQDSILRQRSAAINPFAVDQTTYMGEDANNLNLAKKQPAVDLASQNQQLMLTHHLFPLKFNHFNFHEQYQPPVYDKPLYFV